MTSYRLFPYAFLFCVLSLMGCAGNNTPAQHTAQTPFEEVPREILKPGSASFTIAWPTRTRLIPLAAESLKIVVRMGETEIAQQIVVRPASGTGRVVRFDNLPPGVLSFHVTAHPDAAATQQAQAQGIAQLTVRSSEVTTGGLVLDSTIDHIGLSLTPDTLYPGQEPLVEALALDPRNFSIVTAASKWVWTSNNPAAVQVVASGATARLKPGTARGNATITVQETESGKSTSFVVNNILANNEPDYALFSKIEKVRAAVPNIVVDGFDADWTDVPTYEDAVGDASGIPGLDCQKSSIIATEDAYLIRFTTDNAPAIDPNRLYEVGIDFMDSLLNYDIVIGFQLGSTDGTLWITEPGKAQTSVPVTGLEVAHNGTVTEMRIPYAWLRPKLPASMQSNLPAPATRPHVRFFPRMWGKVGSEWQIKDRGACAASYLIKPTPYTLDDTSLPRPVTAKQCIMRPPLEGVLHINQGAFGTFSHADVWAYDISLVNPEGILALGTGSSNTDHFIWGKPLLAGNPGTIIEVVSMENDLVPGPPIDTAKPNLVRKQIANNIVTTYVHCQKSSAQVSVGQEATDGQVLANAGNSGRSTGPHLHLESYEQGLSTYQTVTTTFRDVKVLIAPNINDPWARDLALWNVKEGYLFTRK
jgi:hypothetical protein